MSKTAIKVFYNPIDKVSLDEAGQIIRNDVTTPATKLTEKGIVNIQLVTAYDEDSAAFTKFTDLALGTTGRAIVDDDFSNPEIVRTLVTGSGHWTASASGTNEYFYTAAVNSEPDNVYENAVAMVAGIVGSLAAGEWVYADNDTIGSSRIYVRLTDDADPDVKSLGFLTYLLASGTYTPNYVDSEEFNNSDTWYDTTTETWRDPVVTAGELTFEYNANTDSYYDRIQAATSASGRAFARTTMQIPMYDSVTGEHFTTYEFDFFSFNRYLPNDQIKLDVATLVVYTKTEVDALVGGKMDNVSPVATAGHIAVFKADGVNVEDGGAVPAAGGGDASGPAWSTNNALARFDSTTGKLLQNGKTIEDDSGNVTVDGDFMADDAAFDSLEVDDDAYAASWDGNPEVPTKNAVYDEMEEKLDSDFSGLVVKSTLDGTEGVLIEDGDDAKQTTVQKVVDLAVASGADVDLEHGIETPASEIDDALEDNRVTAYRTLDTAPSTVTILNHMDGIPGAVIITDDSSYAETATLEGDPVISDTQEVAAGFGRVLHLDGNDGWNYAVTNFDPLATDFGFAGKFYIADANKNDFMPLLHIGTGSTMKRVIEVYFEGGFFKYRIGTDTGSGDWTDSDSVEVVTTGYLNEDDWNSVVFQRYGNELQACLNGYVLMRLDMTGKTMNTPDGVSKIRFGYDIDVSSNPDNFFTGYVDEIILLSGLKFMDIAVGGVTPISFADWSTENYVSKKYDVDDTGGTPASDIGTDTTNFDAILSALDDTVQKALDTLDDGALKKSLNLSDVPDNVTSRNNLAAERAHNGFETDITVTWTDGTRTAAITDSAFTFNVDGVAFTKSAPESVVIPDVKGLYYIYYDSSGTLVASTTFWDLDVTAPVTMAYWSSALGKAIPMHEEHSSIMDEKFHALHHLTQGAEYHTGGAISGYTLQDSTDDTKVTYAISEGKMFDEDIHSTLAVLADAGPYFIVSRTGLDSANEWTWTNTPVVPYLTSGGGGIAWNELTGGSWQQSEVTTNDRYVNMFILGVPAINSNQCYAIIQGQTLHASLAEAEEESFSEIDFGAVLITPESIPVYRVTMRYRSTYSGTTGDCRIEAIQDFRGASSRSVTVAAIGDHQTLDNRDATSAHPASAIEVDATAFSGVLSGTDTDVQTALKTLDAINPDSLDDTATTNKFTTAGDISKLSGVETAADVTDAANVATAGAAMGGGNLTTQYDGVFTNASGEVTKSTDIKTDSSGNLISGKTSKLTRLAFESHFSTNISAGAVTPTHSVLVPLAQTGTVDDLDTINTTTFAGVLLITADTGDSITLTEAGNIDLNGRIVVLNGGEYALLNYNTITSKWVVVAGGIADTAQNAQTGTTYTLVLNDLGKMVTMNNAAAKVVTIPLNSSVAYPVGSTIGVLMLGAGITSITGATGVTVNGVSAGSGDIGEQYKAVTLWKIATDTWLVIGAIGTVS